MIEKFYSTDRCWVLQKTLNPTYNNNYTYDENGNVKTILDAKNSNQKQCFLYDSLDRLTRGTTQLSESFCQATHVGNGQYDESYAYNGTTGNLSSKAGVSYSYNDNNHKHAVTATGSNSYTYDANGNQITRSVGGNSYTLSYDAENRLVSITGSTTETNTYDGDGNRVKSTGVFINLAAGIVPTCDVSLSNAAVVTDNDAWANNSSQYAAAGSSGLHYVQIDLGAIYSVNKIKLWHYVNDGRTYHNTKTQVSENGTNWVTVYDSAVSGEYPETVQGKEINFTTQNVRYIRDYVNGSTVNIGDHWTEIEVWGYGNVTYVGNYFEWYTSTSNMVKYYYAGATRVAMRRGLNNLYWLLSDHLGSQAITADANGSKISEVRYYPWGNDRYYAYTSSTTYRFTGQREDFGNGLYYYGARWYDPAAGRFIQADTIVPGGVQGLDRYAYVGNNPVRYTDPSGNLPCNIDGNCESKKPFTEKTYKKVLNDYGITTEGNWTLSMLREAYNGIVQVGYALSGAMKNNMNSAQAFNYVFGNMKFCSGDCDNYKLGDFYGISHGSTTLFKPSVLTGYGVAHELGHSFETRVYDSLGSNVNDAPINMLTESGKAILDIFNNHISGYDPDAGKYVRTMLGYDDCGLQCSYHPLDMMPEGDTADEDFADMFMNWAYDSFSNDPNGAGAARYDWIDSNMLDWISHLG